MSDINNMADVEYLSNCQRILDWGIERGDRTGTGTISLFGLQMRFDLQRGFPLLTTKFVSFKSIKAELLWFLKGDINTKFLRDNGVSIWDEWADENGSLGPIYGAQWRTWKRPSTFLGEPITYVTDQIYDLVDNIKHRPNSRRHLVSAWNAAFLPDESISPQANVEIGNMALAPCHYSFQCYVADGKLSMLVNQRSADMFLGVPFNIASYALLTHMIAQVCDLEVGELVWNGGDCHIYNNHVEQMNLQIERMVLGKMHNYPVLVLDKSVRHIDDFNMDNISIQDYKHEPAIKGEVAI